MNKVIPIQPVSHEEYESRRKSGEEAAHQNFDALVAQFPWMLDLTDEVMKIVRANAGVRSKFNQLTLLADRVAAAISTIAACRRGCSHCCNISVAISSFEAEKIAEVTGIRPAALKSSVRPETVAADNYKKPCPFATQNGECSIYDTRPLACRLHFNISESPFFCDTQNLPEESAVPNVDLNVFWMGYATLFLKMPLGDIRDFFPPAAVAAARAGNLPPG